MWTHGPGSPAVPATTGSSPPTRVFCLDYVLPCPMLVSPACNAGGKKRDPAFARPRLCLVSRLGAANSLVYLADLTWPTGAMHRSLSSRPSTAGLRRPTRPWCTAGPYQPTSTGLAAWSSRLSSRAADHVGHPQYLLRLAELELIDRHQRMVERRIRAARFPAVKSLDTFDFLAIPSVNKTLVMELARCEYTLRRENVIAVGNSGTGKTHVALGLGLAACQRGMSVGFTTAAGLVHELMEARDERRLLNLQRQLSRLNQLIIDELGFVPLSRTGAELLFEVFNQRYERGSTMVTTNLPFDEWTEVFGSERLTGALLDRLTHHVHILEMNGESYRLKRSREVATPQSTDAPDNA